MTFELNSQQKRSVKARQDLGIDRGLTWISHVSVDLLHDFCSLILMLIYSQILDNSKANHEFTVGCCGRIPLCGNWPHFATDLTLAEAVHVRSCHIAVVV